MLRTDLHAGLHRFGAGALLFRIIDLCEGCPQAFLRQLKDFRSSWQLMEIERVRFGHKEMDFFAAQRVYFLAVMLNAPPQIPTGRDAFLVLVQSAEFASHWNAVLALWHIGAFRERAY